MEEAIDKWCKYAGPNKAIDQNNIKVSEIRTGLSHPDWFCDGIVIIGKHKDREDEEFVYVEGEWYETTRTMISKGINKPYDEVILKEQNITGRGFIPASDSLEIVS